MTAFHEILFPLDIALKSAGGPERRTEIVALGSGPRGAQCALGAFAPALRRGLRRQDAGGAVAGDCVLRGTARPALWLPLARPARSFFGGPGAPFSPPDQTIGSGDGEPRFSLARPMARHSPYQRPIEKPVPAACALRLAP